MDAGRIVGGYEVLERLGAGGMGEVYRARQPALARTVALKVMRGAGDDVSARFDREVRIHIALAHPHLVRVFDAGREDGLRWIAMELVTGATLAHYIDRTAPLPADFLIPAGRALAGALAYLHDRGVAHRDLKPPNVLVADDGALKIADFGLAFEEGHTRMTRAGSLLGTVCYMSPEAAAAAEVGPPADVYALGLMLHEMATGYLPYRGQDLPSWLDAIRNAPPERLSASRPDLASLDDLIFRMLSKEVSSRPSARDVAAELERLAHASAHASLAIRARTMLLNLKQGQAMATAAWRTQEMRVPAARAPRPRSGPVAHAAAVRAGPRPPARAVPWRPAALAVLALCALPWLLPLALQWHVPGARSLALVLCRCRPALVDRDPFASLVLAELAAPDDARTRAALELTAGLPPDRVADALAQPDVEASPELEGAIRALLRAPAGDALLARWLQHVDETTRLPRRLARVLLSSWSAPGATPTRALQLLESPDPSTAGHAAALLALRDRPPAVEDALLLSARTTDDCARRLRLWRAVAPGTQTRRLTAVQPALLADPCVEVRGWAQAGLAPVVAALARFAQSSGAAELSNPELGPALEGLGDKAQQTLLALVSGTGRQALEALRALANDAELGSQLHADPLRERVLGAAFLAFLHATRGGLLASCHAEPRVDLVALALSVGVPRRLDVPGVSESVFTTGELDLYTFLAARSAFPERLATLDCAAIARGTAQALQAAIELHRTTRWLQNFERRPLQHGFAALVERPAVRDETPWWPPIVPDPHGWALDQLRAELYDAPASKPDPSAMRLLLDSLESRDKRLDAQVALDDCAAHLYDPAELAGIIASRYSAKSDAERRLQAVDVSDGRTRALVWTLCDPHPSADEYLRRLLAASPRRGRVALLFEVVGKMGSHLSLDTIRALLASPAAAERLAALPLAARLPPAEREKLSADPDPLIRRALPAPR